MSERPHTESQAHFDLSLALCVYSKVPVAKIIAVCSLSFLAPIQVKLSVYITDQASAKYTIMLVFRGGAF